MSGQRLDLGQHFLRPHLAGRLAGMTGVGPADLVVEIGAGRGALTRAIAARGARVLAVELDPELARLTRSRFADQPDVVVVEADFLTYRLPPQPHVVIGNIPFAHTAAIVRRVTAPEGATRDAWLLVQREAAERYAGRPWAPETLRSLLLKPWWHVEIRGFPRRTDFDPPPAVDTAVIWLSRRPRPLADHGYRAFVRAALGSGRTCAQVLRRHLTRSQVQRLLRDLNVAPSSAPGVLSFEQWLAIYRLVSGQLVR